MRSFKIIALSFLAYFIFIGGSCTKTTPSDPTGNTKIALEANKYLTGCPTFFMPPIVGWSDGTQKNQSGAVAWTSNGITGNPGMVETKNRYIERLSLSSVANQTSWIQYQQIAGGGFPGVNNNTPNPEYQTGFVCYSLVYNSFKDAGYSNLWSSFPIDTDKLVEVLTEYPASQARVGDVVVFNWDNGFSPTWWDHAGIIVNIDAADPKNWLIVSSLGWIEIFNWGAQKTRLGVFGTTNGGQMTYWPPDLENWTVKVYGSNF